MQQQDYILNNSLSLCMDRACKAWPATMADHGHGRRPQRRFSCGERGHTGADIITHGAAEIFAQRAPCAANGTMYTAP